MTARRPYTDPTLVSTQESRILDPQNDQPQRAPEGPAISPSTVMKLMLFTFLMITAPLSVYYALALTICANNTTWAGAAAALTANAVLLGYIFMAFWEDQGDEPVKEKGTVGKRD